MGVFRLWLIVACICQSVDADSSQLIVPIVEESVTVFPDRFIEHYLIDVPQIGIPGRSFRVQPDWVANISCIREHPFDFTETYHNRTDFIYLPRAVFRDAIFFDPVTCYAPPSADGILAFGYQASIWKLYPIMTVQLALRNNPSGQLVIGGRDPQVFSDLDGDRRIVPCELFPTLCWLPAVLWSTNVRLIFAVGEHQVLLGSALFALYQANPHQRMLFQLPLDGSTLHVDEVSETFLPHGRPTRPAPAKNTLSNNFALLKRDSVHLCPPSRCPESTDVIVGVVMFNWAVVMDSVQQQLEFGDQYMQTVSTTYNPIFLLALVVLYLWSFSNAYIRLPPFIGHEESASAVLQSQEAPAETAERKHVVYLKARELAIERMMQTRQKTNVSRSRAGRPIGTSGNSASEEPASEQQIDTKIREIDTNLMMLHAQLRVDAELRFEQVFGLYTVIPEVAGLIIVLLTVLVNIVALDLPRRVQFSLIIPAGTDEPTGQPVLFTTLGVLLALLVSLHIFFLFATPPCVTHKPFGNGVNSQRGLLLLMRRVVYEAELHIGIWITVVDGPLQTINHVLSFVNGVFALYMNALYLSIYLFHLASRYRINWLTFCLVLIHLLMALLFVVFILQPSMLLLWQRFHSSSTVWLLTFTLYSGIWLSALFSERQIAMNENDYMEFMIYAHIHFRQQKSRFGSSYVNPATSSSMRL